MLSSIVDTEEDVRKRKNWKAMLTGTIESVKMLKLKIGIYRTDQRNAKRKIASFLTSVYTKMGMLLANLRKFVYAAGKWGMGMPCSELAIASEETTV